MHERIASEINRIYSSDIPVGTIATLFVGSSSMKPFILPGATLSVQGIPAPELRPGDIIVFSRDDELYVHRLIRRMSRCGRLYFLTKGDNARVFDEPVSSEEVLGRAVSSQSAAGTVNFQTGFRKMIGRSVAMLSYLEALLYGQLRTLKRSILRSW